MTRGAGLGPAVAAAGARLAAAGVASARLDAEELAAHAAGTSRMQLGLLDGQGALPEEFFDRYAALVAARARRVPLQHLIGSAAFGSVQVHVGPGVFVPRPETEALLEWSMDQRLPARPLVVDVCTGSGALALALARHVRQAQVIAVDDSAEALSYARRNVVGTDVELRRGDVHDAALFPDLDGRVDLLVANPPYLPDGAALEPEVAEHDPHHALFGGPGGTDVIAAVVRLAARWLRPAGQVAIEHDDDASGAVQELLTRTAEFDAVAGHCDLAGRSRFVTARRAVRR